MNRKLSGEGNTLDFSSLSGLEKLTKLKCNSNGLTEIKGLESLINLTNLHCSTNKLTELKGLGNLTKLDALYCNSNNLAELTGLGNLTKLEFLDCSHNNLAELTGLDNLTMLNVLGCSHNNLAKLTGLDNLMKLNVLHCYNNPYTAFTTKGGKTLTVTPAKGGTVIMTDYNLSNNNVELTATPDTGYTFEKWEPLPTGVTDNGNKITFTLDKDIIVQASFAKSAIPVTGVKLDKPTLTLTTGQTAKLAVTVEPANASNKTVKWESGNHSVAIVSNGAVTAAAPGNAIITATTTDGGYQATCNVTVNSPENPDNGNNGNHGGDDNRNDTNDYTITTPEPPKPNTAVLAVIDLPVSVTEGKPATGTADDGRTAAALTGAGNQTGAKQNGIAVRYDAKTSLSYDGFSITIKRATLDRLIENKVKYVSLNTGIVDLTLDLAALTETQKQAAGDSNITLTATREKNLTRAALEAVGRRAACTLCTARTEKALSGCIPATTGTAAR